MTIVYFTKPTEMATQQAESHKSMAAASWYQPCRREDSCDSCDSTDLHSEPPAPFKQPKSVYRGINWGAVSAATFNKTNQAARDRILPKAFVPLRKLMAGKPDPTKSSGTGAEPILKSCLKKNVPVGSPKPFGKSVSFKTEPKVHKVANLRLECKNEVYWSHENNERCYGCKACKENPLDPITKDNLVTIASLAKRLRRGRSEADGIVFIDESLLVACFNAHRMTVETLTGLMGRFLCSIWKSPRAMDRVDHYLDMIETEKLVIKDTRRRRRRGIRYTTSLNNWAWLDMKREAPEIRDLGPNYEYQIHWEKLEQAEIDGYHINIKRSSGMRSKSIELTPEHPLYGTVWDPATPMPTCIPRPVVPTSPRAIVPLCLCSVRAAAKARKAGEPPSRKLLPWNRQLLTL
ncbi:hypothetical protein LIA77_05297 [Sarocladium implicatum]|nr:hypothetical protein LIA77_05297 [Sarocladium implicatum]